LNDLVHINELWALAELIAAVEIDMLPGDRRDLLE
jgi:hypothetical protein